MNVSNAYTVLAALGFKFGIVTHAGVSREGYILHFPGSKRGLQATVLTEGFKALSPSTTRRVVLRLADKEGREVHQPVHCRNVEELAQQFRDGVWDGFWDSTLSLNPRRA
jgi:hypothetical protein